MKEYVKLHLENINKTIEEIVNNELKSYVNKTDKIKRFLELYNDTTYGGKRVRALLVVLGYEMFSDKFNEEIYKAAAAYELFQSAILIHDDVIDESDLRRGKKTIHNLLGNNHLAMSNAICLGDYGIFLSEKILSELDFEIGKVLEGLKTYQKVLLNTVVGEILDVNLPFEETNKEDDVLNIAYYKTSWYTIIGPLLLGAALAGADSSKLNALENFGTHLGIAFQMKDDILGIYGDENVVGKSVTSDIKEKKLTLLYTHVNKVMTDEEKIEFNKYYGNKDVTCEECKKVIDIFNKYNAKEKVEEKINEEVEKTKEYVSKITNNKKWEDILIGLINMLTVRDK